MQTQQQPQQFQLTDEEWKLNQAKTTEYRRKIFNFILGKIQNQNPQLQSQFIEIEKRFFSESNTRQEYTNKIQSYYQNLIAQHQQQQQQHQPQQQIGQTNEMIQQQQNPNMPHQQIQVNQIRNVQMQQQQQPQQQQQQPQNLIVKTINQQGQMVIINNNPNAIGVPNKIINLNSTNPQQLQLQQQQQLKLQQQQQQQQVIRPGLPSQVQVQPQTQFVTNNMPPNLIAQQSGQTPTGTSNWQTGSIQQQQQQQPQNIIITTINQPQAQSQVPQQIQSQQPQQQQQQQQIMNQQNMSRNQMMTNINVQQATLATSNIIQTHQQLPPQQQQQQQQQQYNPNMGQNLQAPGLVKQQHQTQQQQQMNSSDDELYNRKIEELKQNHLPRLEKMLANALGKNLDDKHKIKAFIDVVMGVKKVSMETLLKCEASLNQQKAAPSQQPLVQSQTGIPPQQVQQQILAQKQPIQTQEQQQQQQQQQTTIINQSHIASQIKVQQSYQQTATLVQQQIQPSSKILQPQSVPVPTQPLMPSQQLQQQQPQLQQPQASPSLQIKSELDTKLRSIPSVPLVMTPSTQSHLQQPTSIQHIQTPQQMATSSIQPTRQLNPFQLLNQSIESCNNSNAFHKSNVRYLIENIRNSIDGPPIKLFKLDKDSFKGVSDDSDTDLKRKPLINLRENLSTNKINTNEHIPKKLLIELASLSNSKFRIEAKSKNETIILPISNKTISTNKIMNDFDSKEESEFDKNENQDTDMNESKQTENDSYTNSIYDTISTTQSSKFENYYVTLKCMIVNNNLALVPPIRIFIPYNYPESNPFVDCIQTDESEDDMLPEYNKLGILRRINKKFQVNYLRLSERFSATQLLDAWYSSVESL